MDVDPMEYVEPEDDGESVSNEAHEKEKAKSRLNSVVAVTVALIAAFMALCNVKDGNIVQAMQQDQADQIDNWGYYQARNIRQTVYESTIDQLKLMALSASPAAKPEISKQVASYQAKAAEQAEKKKEPQAKAQDAKKEYDAWNVHDDQFDLSEALLSLSIALMAATALTQKKWLYGVALVPIFFGLLYGLAGLLGWGLHSNLFARVLGT